jgi:hypothetical protein
MRSLRNIFMVSSFGGCGLLGRAVQGIDTQLTNSTVQELLPPFADSLTSLLYENANECSSSWGISMAFDLLYPGSDGETKGSTLRCAWPVWRWERASVARNCRSINK